MKSSNAQTKLQVLLQLYWFSPMQFRSLTILSQFEACPYPDKCLVHYLLNFLSNFTCSICNCYLLLYSSFPVINLFSIAHSLTPVREIMSIISFPSFQNSWQSQEPWIIDTEFSFWYSICPDCACHSLSLCLYFFWLTDSVGFLAVV